MRSNVHRPPGSGPGGHSGWRGDGGFRILILLMRFSLQLQYAISGIFDLAYNGSERPTQIRVIGERQGIPTRYLEQIFRRLRQAGLVSAKRGPGGGYVLMRDPVAVSLADIIEAVEGPIDGRSRPSRADSPKPDAARGPDFLWPLLASRFRDVLVDITLADLCRAAAREGVPRLNVAPQDYQI